MIKVLYLFSGKRRKTNVAAVLRAWSLHAEFEIEVDEWDILNGPSFDLLADENRDRLLAAISQGIYAAVLMSPPCGTWSRAPWANQFGPRPLRSSGFPWGFAWLEGHRLKKVAASNSMVRLCLQVLELIEKSSFTIYFWLEHPEDLGSVSSYRRRARRMWFARVDTKIRPASIWQLPQLRRLLQLPGTLTRVFHQCAFGADSPKPTRVFTDLAYFGSLGYSSWPQLDHYGAYTGPLPRQCACGRPHQQLISKNSKGDFKTTAAAAYPPAMDEFLATALWFAVQAHSSSFLKRAGTGDQKEPLEVPETSKAVEEDQKEPLEVPETSKALGETPRPPGTTDPPQPQKAINSELKEKDQQALGKKRAMEEIPEERRTKARTSQSLPFKLAPLQVWYKGKMRRMADGLGKCSPGVRPAGSRGIQRSKGASVLAASFWREVETIVDGWSREERLRTIVKLSLGRFEASPFKGVIEGVRHRLDEVVVGLGKQVKRRDDDRSSEIHFRRLAAWAEIFEDEDCRYLSSMASRGVPLGTRSEIGRVTAAYDAKSKEEEDKLPAHGWVEDFEHSHRDNYISATAHLDMVRKHIEEDIEKGWISSLSLEEAKRTYGEELQIASLGAVPKDQQWSDVRVVHDGTHGIQVNSRIAQPNRMEFPQFDDLQAALRAFQMRDPSQKLLVAFDIKSAHRLIPVQQQDWGLQAFQLEKEGPVYINRVGGHYGLFLVGQGGSYTFQDVA